MKTDDSIKRLRWVMVFTILFDLSLTFAGQPASFWETPSTVKEGEPIMRYMLAHGYTPVLCAAAVYALVMVLLVSVLPRRFGLVLLMFISLQHYFGASAWLNYHFRFAHGDIVYGLILSVIFVALGLDTRQKLSPNREESHGKIENA
jgi:hypothetical protein